MHMVMHLCNFQMNFVPKTTLELHRELVSSGIFDRETQASLATATGVNQATISRIAQGQFKRVNKSVVAICKYAHIKTTRNNSAFRQLKSLLASRSSVADPEKRKLIDIIDLAVDLLERR
jgi:transcriptional regulator with XRE-family HTH domain